MTRVKRGTISRSKHKKTLKLARGYRGTRSRLIKTAHEAVLHADKYSFHGRKRKKRDLRRLWITRINGALKEKGYSYSEFIKNLKGKEIILDRKIIAGIVNEDPKTFETILSKVFTKPRNA